MYFLQNNAMENVTLWLWSSVHYPKSSPHRIADCKGKMRIDIVQNAPQRVESDYVLWPDRGQEHATQYYPQWELWRYPKKYMMQNQGIDQDLCQKSFNSSRTFTNGVFR